MMKLTSAIFGLLTLISFNSPSLAQIRGESSSEFFEQGQQQIDQEVERLETQREQPEENLEQTLEVEKPKPLEVEETPDIPASLDENVPESPEQEVEIKF